jgi:hypothetical protein
MNEQTQQERTQQRLQEASKRTTRETARIADQMASAGAETFAAWVGVRQGVANDMLELNRRTITETSRLVSEMQEAGLETLQQIQSSAMRWQMAWPEALRDPFRWYQRMVEETVNGTQQTLELSRRNAETMMRVFERMHGSAGETTRTVGERFRTAATRMQEAASKAERRRAA